MPTTTQRQLPTREMREELACKAEVYYEPLRARLEKDHWGE